MRIEWLNEDFTRARLTRGWIWKRTTVVYRDSDQYWHYEGTEVRSKYDRRLDRQRHRAAERDRRDRIWQPVAKLPTARTVKP